MLTYFSSLLNKQGMRLYIASWERTMERGRAKQRRKKVISSGAQTERKTSTGDLAPISVQMKGMHIRRSLSNVHLDCCITAKPFTSEKAATSPVLPIFSYTYTLIKKRFVCVLMLTGSEDGGHVATPLGSSGSLQSHIVLRGASELRHTVRWCCWA